MQTTSTPDVTIVLTEDHYILCKVCRLNPYNILEPKYGFKAYNIATMLTHLHSHEKAGHEVTALMYEEIISHEQHIFPEGGTGGGHYTKPNVLASSVGPTH